MNERMLLLHNLAWQLLALQKAGITAAAIALALYITRDQSSTLAKVVCILLATVLLAEGSVLLRLRLMSPDVSTRSYILLSIIAQGSVLAAVGFGAFSTRLRYVCLLIASTAPLMLLAIRHTE